MLKNARFHMQLFEGEEKNDDKNRDYIEITSTFFALIRVKTIKS